MEEPSENRKRKAAQEEAQAEDVKKVKRTTVQGDSTTTTTTTTSAENKAEQEDATGTTPREEPATTIDLPKRSATEEPGATTKAEKESPTDQSDKPADNNNNNNNNNNISAHVDKPTVFGSSVGFSGFGAVKSTGFGTTSSGGFGSNHSGGFATSSTGTGFGQSSTGFGSFASSHSSAFATTSSLGFGTAKAFGELKKAKSAFGVAPTVHSSKDPAKDEEEKAEHEEEETTNESSTAVVDDFKPVAELPKDYDAKTGEEEETTLYKGRCKTRRLAPNNKTEESPNPAPVAMAAPAVPHSESFLGKTSSSDTSASSPEVTWQEVGIGPLKVLQHNTTQKIRLVQRQEEKKEGPGLRVIVNALLLGGSLTKIHQPSEKHVQWATPVDGKAVTYLFTFKTPEEASRLFQVLVEHSGGGGGDNA